MTAIADKITALRAMGVELRVEGNEIKLRYPPIYADRIRPFLNDLRQQREAVVQVLQESCTTDVAERQLWSERSLELAERFDRPFMRLFPLIGKRVSTPKGRGRLEHVLGKVARVVLDADPTRMTDFDWEEILPLPV